MSPEAADAALGMHAGGLRAELWWDGPPPAAPAWAQGAAGAAVLVATLRARVPRRGGAEAVAPLGERAHLLLLYGTLVGLVRSADVRVRDAAATALALLGLELGLGPPSPAAVDRACCAESAAEDFPPQPLR